MTMDSLTAYHRQAGALDFGRRGEWDDTSACDCIVALFEKHRATPGAPYDAHHFVDFFRTEPTGRRTVFDGLRASRRFNAFIDDVQYGLAICFSPYDRKANYSLQEFVDRAIELAGARAGSPLSLKKQVTAGLEWSMTVLADILLLIAVVWLRGHEWALVSLAALAVFVNAWFATFACRAWGRFKRLQSRIEARKVSMDRVTRLRPRARLAYPAPPGTPFNSASAASKPRRQAVFPG